MRVCGRCVLPEGFPGIQFDSTGVCNLCRARAGGEVERSIRERTARRFGELAEVLRKRPGIHCLMAFSGGKDSTYTLMMLRRQFGLRVLAVTFDNGFLSPAAFENARKVVEALDAEHLVVKPRMGFLRRVFAGVATSNPFPAKCIERASPICNACMGLAKGAFLRVALERRIPVLAYGWSPGQAPTRAGFFRLNQAMLDEMQQSRLAPMSAVAGDELSAFSLGGMSLVGGDGYPYSVNPLSFIEYDESRIVSEIAPLGWTAPRDTDGNSTNCLLNLLSTRLHIRQYGFHPYAFEIAGLVRGGFMKRADGLAKLEDLGDRRLAEEVARRLEMDVSF